MTPTPKIDGPPAYLITFNCYGTRLHGDSRGTVDPHHNSWDGEKFIVHSGVEKYERDKMSQLPYELDEPRRKIVLRTVIEVCEYRKWELLAVHVRSTHVHVVVDANEKPEKVMRDFKAYCSRRLTEAGFDDAKRKRWARHGSTVYKWKPEDVVEAIDYVVRGQGDPPMEIYERNRSLMPRSLTFASPIK